MNVKKKKRKLISSHLKPNNEICFMSKKTYQNANRKKNYPPKNISECKLRILRCSTNCKNRIGNQFEMQSFLEHKKEREDDLGYKKPI